MGLYDRDYYRDDDPQFGGFGGGTRSMVTTLILINVGVAIAQFLLHGNPRIDITDWLGLEQELFRTHWRVWELVTYGFAHDPTSVMHVAVNMFVLWMFGTEVEGQYGKRAFLGVYLTAIIVAGLGWLLVENVMSPNPPRPALLLGASGAVTTIVVLFVFHYPMRPIYLFGILPIPAWILGVLYILQDISGLAFAAKGSGPHVAYAAHLTGALYGYIFYKTRWSLERLVPRRFSMSLPRRRPKFTIHREEPDETQNLSQRVDEILEKISRQGESSLSDEERRILQDASKKYQQRRR
jgi:membrane associated rhomboid family serine protease